MKLNKYIFISFVLHLSLLLVYIPKSQEKKEEKTEITLTENTSNDVFIKPIGDQDGEENKNFYWGLGISVYDFGDVKFITDVSDGYNGELSGLKKGDEIIALNNLPLSEKNDIKGDSPAKLKLTIRRNNVIIIIYTERCKVYY